MYFPGFRSESDEPRFVYVLGGEGQPFKIGSSVNPKVRSRSFGLMGWAYGGVLHKRLFGGHLISLAAEITIQRMFDKRRFRMATPRGTTFDWFNVPLGELIDAVEKVVPCESVKAEILRYERRRLDKT